MDDKKRDELAGRYQRALHGMQAGVALDVARGASDCTPKHLRVGVNAAMVDSGALAQLLIKKGVFTEEEYLTALAEGAEAERARYEAEASARAGVPIKLA